MCQVGKIFKGTKCVNCCMYHIITTDCPGKVLIGFCDSPANICAHRRQWKWETAAQQGWIQINGRCHLAACLLPTLQVRFFSTADIPEAVVEFCMWMRDARQQGRFTSIYRGLHSLGKDWQSVQRWKHVYYMAKQDEARYKEVSKVTSHYTLLLNTQGCVYTYTTLFSWCNNGVVAERSLYPSWVLCAGGM